MNRGLFGGMASSRWSPPSSSLVLCSAGAAGIATGAGVFIPWNRSGNQNPPTTSVVPITSGNTDIELHPTTNTFIRVLTDCTLAVSCFAGVNSLNGSANSPINSIELATYINGSKANFTQGFSVYLGGMWQGAVANIGFTLDFQAGDSFRFFVVCTTDVTAHTVTTASGTSTITDTVIQPTDLNKPITGAGIPALSYVGTVTPGVSFVLSSTRNGDTPVNATASATVVGTLGGENWGLEANTNTIASIVRLR
jgi:hypothetical protein